MMYLILMPPMPALFLMSMTQIGSSLVAYFRYIKFDTLATHDSLVSDVTDTDC